MKLEPPINPKSQAAAGRTTAAGRWRIWLLWAVLALYWAVLFWGTHRQFDPGGTPPPISDKVLHFAGYAGLGALLMLAAWTGLRRVSLGFGLSLAVAALYGAVDEWSQSFVPGRVADVYDWWADVAGGGFGALVVALILSWRRRSRSETKSASP